MNNINFILAFAIIVAYSPILNASAFSEPVSEIRYVSISTADVDETNATARIGIDELSLKSILTTKDVKNGKLIFSVDYKYTEFTVQDNTEQRTDVHQASLMARYITQRDKWRHIFSIAPGLYSDLEEITTDDLDVTASYNFMYSSSDQLQWIAGIGYSRTFGDPIFFPIIGATIQPNEYWQFKLGFPVSSASYSPSSDWHSYVKLQPNGGKWNLDAKGSNDVNMIYSSFELLAGIEKDLAKNLWLGIEAGYSFAREFEFNDASSNNSLGEVDLKDASFIAVNLRYKP